MQMRRIISSIFLALALLLFPLTDRAQQSAPATKPQASSSPDAKPQAPQPTQPAAAKQEPTQQSDQTIKSVVNLVDVLFTVLNRRKFEQDTVGSVQEHADAQRQIGLFAKVADFLRIFVVPDLEIAL